MRRRTAALPSLESIEDLGMRAASGDEKAYDELGAMAEKLGRRANQRMRELEKAGKTGDAYQRIKDSIGGRKRFSQARTGNVEDIVKRVKKSMSALARKESTISGIKEVDNQTLQSLYNRFGIDKKVTPDVVNRFNRFVESAVWNDFKKLMGGSGGILEQFTKSLADNPEAMDDLIESFEQWAEMEEADRPDVYEAVNEWFDF